MLSHVLPNMSGKDCTRRCTEKDYVPTVSQNSSSIPAGGLTELLTEFIATYVVEVVSLKSSSSNKGGGKTLVCGECEQPGPIP